MNDVILFGVSAFISGFLGAFAFFTCFPKITVLVFCDAFDELKHKDQSGKKAHNGCDTPRQRG